MDINKILDESSRKMGYDHWKEVLERIESCRIHSSDVAEIVLESIKKIRE